MKALFIILGESFRQGGWLSRETGAACSYPDQKLACDSHINFIKFLKVKFDVDTDVIIDTYMTPYKNDLLHWYEPYLKEAAIHECKAFGFENLYRHALTLINNYEDYEFIHFFRIDLYLKPYFSQVFKMTDKLQYSFRTTPIPFIECVPRLNDMMLYVPRNHFDILKRNIVLLHDLYIWGLIQRCGLKKSVCTYIKTIHDSNTRRDWNPLFRIVNRPESIKWEWYGYTWSVLTGDPEYTGRAYDR